MVYSYNAEIFLLKCAEKKVRYGRWVWSGGEILCGEATSPTQELPGYSTHLDFDGED